MKTHLKSRAVFSFSRNALLVSLQNQPSFITASILWLAWIAFAVIDGVLVVSPKADSDDNVVPPVLTKDDGHPLQHGRQAITEPGCSPIKGEENGARMVDHVGKGVQHLLDQDLLVVRVTEAGMSTT